ncbi:MAG: OadG family transporter subunit [Bacteroidia bacterium]
MDSYAINQALQLLVVGMGTVFIILGLVVFMGRQLIGAVNRWMPEAVASKANVSSPDTSSAIEPGVLAAIVAAVDIVTGGIGIVEHVEKK